MPSIQLPDAHIHHEIYGPGPEHEEGLPVLLLAPGGLRSRIGLWRHTHDGRSRPWPDPTVELARKRRVIAIDQRTAGFSRGRLSDGDGWHTFAADHLGVADALGLDRFHVLGACIGSSFALALAQIAPERIASAVLQQPIGWTPENAPLRGESFEAWSAGARERSPGVSDATLHALEHKLYGGADFVFSVTRDFVRRTRTPLLILAGNDVHHPLVIARELHALQPRATYIEQWKGELNRRTYIDGVNDFFARSESTALHPPPTASA